MGRNNESRVGVVNNSRILSVLWSTIFLWDELIDFE